MSARRLAVALLFGLSGAAHAQGALTVAPDHPLYRDVDRLIDAGLIDTVVVGQRPYSRVLIARLARQARSRLGGPDARDAVRSSLTRTALRRLLAAVAPEMARLDGTAVDSGLFWSPLRAIRFDALATDARARTVPDNGLGTVEADLNTLTNYRHGRRLATGANLSIESDHAAQLPGGIALQVRPRLWWHGARDGVPGDVSAELLAASVRVVRRNVALTVGREYTLWAPTEGAGVFFSENAPALDMIRVASDVPFVLPSILRFIGPIAATVQLADVGRSISNSHSRLVSYKLSAKPSGVLELGATFDNHFGGAGAKNPSASARFFDLLPFVDVFRRHADSTDFDSDKLLGLDARLRLSRLANVTLFGEMGIEDFDYHRLGSILTEDAAYTAGVIVPTLVSPALSARLSYHVTGLRFYSHHLVKNGIAANRFILGDDLGRDATGYYGMLRWERATGLSISANVAYEERRSDGYRGAYTNPDLTGLVFTKVSASPRERRARSVVEARWHPGGGQVELSVQGGAERVTNFAFVSDRARTRGVAAITMLVSR